MDEAPTIGGGGNERAEDGWLVLEYPNNPVIRVDARRLDRVFADDAELFLNIAEFVLSITISRGAPIARSIAEDLIPFTRSPPITDSRVYEDAKRRLASLAGDGASSRAPIVRFGEDAVRVGNELVHVGKTTFWLSDVEHYASAGWAIRLPNGWLQAGFALLAIADRDLPEDPAQLAKRISEYEARVSSP